MAGRAPRRSRWRFRVASSCCTGRRLRFPGPPAAGDASARENIDERRSRILCWRDAASIFGHSRPMMGLCWLPEPAEWRERLHGYAEGGSDAWEGAVALAKLRLDFVRTNALDSIVRQRLGVASQRTGDTIRLALLGSSTMAHLHAAIRVAGLRQGLLVEIYENAYGQYWQELNDPASALHVFCPDTVVFAFDGPHLAAGVDAALPAADAEAVFAMAANRLRDCWRLAHRAFACRVIQQTPLPVYPHLLGSNEHRLPGSRAHVLVRLGEHLRAMADDAGVDLLAVDRQAARDGLAG